MFEEKNNEMIFKYGKEDYEKARIMASNCPFYTIDPDDEELVTSYNQPSCYNCLYRKWTQSSFVCVKRKKA